MSGGISAIKGFDYQATVILDRVFRHFDERGRGAMARPERIDDLDLTWTGPDGEELCRLEQIKKPREDRNVLRKPRAWSLAETIDQLLPNTLANLAGNTREQVWILGDEVEPDVGALVDAGLAAPVAVASSYWRVVHSLALQEALAAAAMTSLTRSKLLRWRIGDDVTGEAAVTAAFGTKALALGAGPILDRYRLSVRQIHAALPDVLSRTRIESLYGTEDAVMRRVNARLRERYGLSPSVIENTLFRNLRGFINDISKQPNRRFGLEELEYELRCVWPDMVVVKDPPPVVEGFVARPDLASLLAVSAKVTAIEAVGVSGSGKTTLAADTIRRAQAADPLRISFYCEVKSGDGFRDALVGIAFHMRRFGIPEPFGIAVEEAATDGDAIERLARSFASARRDTLLVMDLVEGTCSDAFARDLAAFVPSISSPACRIIVFGQESAFRAMTALERDEHGVRHTDIRGFRFEEFVELVSQRHPDPDRSRLHDIFQRVTAGRSAGLFASLAQALSRAPSVDAMAAIASRPRADMLRDAERERFVRISGAARPAAEKLVCFALPFSKIDAEAIFADDNVGLAIRELSTLGLLRANDEETFEMHEIVRAGLEGMLATAVRREAHKALAAWYASRGLHAAEILHLQESGDGSGARRRARDVFLRGEAWGSLAVPITKDRLVSGREVIEVFAGPSPVDSAYLFAEILQGLGESVDVDDLMRLMREQQDRFQRDFQWAAALVDAILQFDPRQVDAMIAIVLRTEDDPRRQESALGMIRLRMRRNGATATPTTIAFFASAPRASRGLLLPFMLSDGRSDALRPAFEFIVSSEKPLRGAQGARWSGLTLKVEDRADATAILSSLPEVEASAMLASGSPLLDELAPLVWEQRAALRTHCVAILRSDENDAKVLESAIRVLIFLMEPDICSLCEQVAARSSGRIHGFASLAPAMAPALVDTARLEARVLDPQNQAPDRALALTILATIGADMGRLHARVRATGNAPDGGSRLDPLFLMLCAQAPFKEAIPLLEERLRAEPLVAGGWLQSAFIRLATLPEALPMLLRTLASPNTHVRRLAASLAGDHRSRWAAQALVTQFGRERDEGLAVAFATAIVASGPDTTSCLDHDRPATPALQLWQCILATRLRDEGFADRIATIAMDTSLGWQVRRAAISAAGRLPFDAALARIAPSVMAERTPLAIDADQDLSYHSSLCSLLLTEATVIRPLFMQGRQPFVAFLSEILVPHQGATSSGQPTGPALAEWLHDRLSHHRWASDVGAPDRVLDELHVPLLQSALLRALRRAGRHDLIEAEIARAFHVWVVIKCLIERSKGPGGPDLVARLKASVAASPFRNEGVLERVIENAPIARPTTPRPRVTPSYPDAEPPPSKGLSYGEAVRLLGRDGSEATAAPEAPWVLDAVTRDEFEHLVRLAAPANDRYRRVEFYEPMVSFTRDGHSVAQRRSTSSNETEPAAAAIRPAIAAANVFGVEIAWHRELTHGVFASSYIPRLLACLDARDDGNRFYEELFGHPDTLLPYLCSAALPRYVRHLDARIVPLLSMYASSGTDELFETLCGLAGRIVVQEIDPALGSLLSRWVRSFDLRSPGLQHADNYPLWRGFGILTSHPRFPLVRDWQPRLADVLRVQLHPFRQQSISRVLERHPRSYIQIEALLFKAEDWEHFFESEIDRLDAAADALFKMTDA
jgi:hypothetical protein